MKLDNRLSLKYFLFFWIKRGIRYLLSNLKYKKKNLSQFENLILKIKKIFKDNKLKKKFILFVCLDEFPIFFFIIWSLVSLKLYKKNYGIKIISTKKNIKINKLSKFLNFKIRNIEDQKQKNKDSVVVTRKINNLNTAKDFYNFKYQNFDLGYMIISNFCRIHKVGFINFDSYLQKRILKNSLKQFIKEYQALFKDDFYKDIKITYTFEKNLFPYLHFFLFSIKRNINLIHWAGSNLSENSFILRKYNKKNIYLHHSTITSQNWKIGHKISQKKILNYNKKIFNQRYSGKFKPFAQNLLTVKSNFINKRNDRAKKNCIIFSHILHDTLYFYGKEYYDSYAHWLVATVKSACQNDNLNWYVKFHPSNIYRGEFKRGKSKEEDILRQSIKKIPPHVKFIYPDDKVSALGWMKFADIGVTIRGTSGLEMATMGKPVFTCGRNRYENRGFTIDSKNHLDFEKKLKNLPHVKQIKSTKDKANKFFYFLFAKKIFNCDFIKVIKNNKSSFSWDKINYKLDNNFLNKKTLSQFSKFVLSNKATEFLNK